MIGRTISHYRIVDKLGEGGMGVVYRARDLDLPRYVALKCLPARLAGSGPDLDRLEREARVLCTLSHANIAVIHGFEKIQGDKFLVLEYLPGGTLKDKLDKLRADGKTLSPNQALTFAIEIAEGIAHAHAHGIVHRDLKPSNVLFTEYGAPKVTDFGLAGAGGSAGVVQGTPAYMSPEQAQGLDIDQRSDIFSFGIVLFELLTGHVPFRGADHKALMSAIVNDPAPPIHQFRALSSESLELVVAKLLEKDRGKRYQSMEEALPDLRSLRSQMSALSALETVDLAALRPHSRLGWLAWSGAVVVAVLLAVAWWLFLKPPPEKHIAVLPFIVLDQDPMTRAIADGIAETLSSKLTQLEPFQGSLWVVPFSDVRAESVDAPLKARRVFGANLALTGNVRRTGERLLLSINLVDALRSRQLNTVSREVPLSDLSSIQGSLAEDIFRMLQLEINANARAALAAGETAAPGAYEFYLQGLGYLRRGAVSADEAVALFQQALQQDSNYALAYAGLCEAFVAKWDGTRDKKWLEPARENCNESLRLNPGSAPAHVMLGAIYRRTNRLEDSVQEYNRALAIDPSNAAAYTRLANIKAATGKQEEAEALHKKAINVRPGDWAPYYALGAFYWARGRYREAETVSLQALQLAPDNTEVLNNLGPVYIRENRLEDAARVLKRSLEIHPSVVAYSNLSYVYYLQGNYKESVPLWEKTVDLSPNDARMAGNLADVYRWTSNQDKARQTYQRAIDLAEQDLSTNALNARMRASLSKYYAYSGNKSKAILEIERASAQAPKEVEVLFARVEVLEAIGDSDRALEALAAALRAGFPVNEVERNPDLAKLRGDPRYKQMSAPYSQGAGQPGNNPKPK